MTDRTNSTHIGGLEDMGRRFVDAGLIEQNGTGEVVVAWDRIVTELDLAA